MVDNCNTEDIHIHMDNNYMDIHTDSYKDNKVGTRRCQGSCLLNHLKRDHLPQIQTRHSFCNSFHNHHDAYYQNVPSISPFLTYPIRDGLCEEGRTPIGQFNNGYSGIQFTTEDFKLFIQSHQHLPYARQL